MSGSMHQSFWWIHPSSSFRSTKSTALFCVWRLIVTWSWTSRRWGKITSTTQTWAAGTSVDCRSMTTRSGPTKRTSSNRCAVNPAIKVKSRSGNSHTRNVSYSVIMYLSIALCVWACIGVRSKTQLVLHWKSSCESAKKLKSNWKSNVEIERLILYFTG